MQWSSLLTADAVINLGLGLLLLFFPSGLVSLLGLPGTQVAFYPSILGAVLLGIAADGQRDFKPDPVGSRGGALTDTPMQRTNHSRLDPPTTPLATYP